jgi:hypothetical protein
VDRGALRALYMSRIPTRDVNACANDLFLCTARFVSIPDIKWAKGPAVEAQLKATVFSSIILKLKAFLLHNKAWHGS